MLKKLLKPVGYVDLDNNSVLTSIRSSLYCIYAGRAFHVHRWLPSYRRCSVPHAQSQSVSHLWTHVSIQSTRCNRAAHRQQSDQLNKAPILPQERLHCGKVCKLSVIIIICETLKFCTVVTLMPKLVMLFSMSNSSLSPHYLVQGVR